MEAEPKKKGQVKLENVFQDGEEGQLQYNDLNKGIYEDSKQESSIEEKNYLSEDYPRFL